MSEVMEIEQNSEALKSPSTGNGDEFFDAVDEVKDDDDDLLEKIDLATSGSLQKCTVEKISLKESAENGIDKIAEPSLDADITETDLDDTVEIEEAAPTSEASLENDKIMDKIENDLLKDLEDEETDDLVNEVKDLLEFALEKDDSAENEEIDKKPSIDEISIEIDKTMDKTEIESVEKSGEIEIKAENIEVKNEPELTITSEILVEESITSTDEVECDSPAITEPPKAAAEVADTNGDIESKLDELHSENEAPKLSTDDESNSKDIQTNDDKETDLLVACESPIEPVSRDDQDREESWESSSNIEDTPEDSSDGEKAVNGDDKVQENTEEKVDGNDEVMDEAENMEVDDVASVDKNKETVDEVEDEVREGEHLCLVMDQDGSAEPSVSLPDPEPKEFIPLKLNFVRKYSTAVGKLSRTELEELLIQKITETIMFNSENTELRTRLEKQEKKSDAFKMRLENVKKQYNDLEMIHNRVMKDLKDRPDAPITPVKITRAVGLQVYQPNPRGKTFTTPTTQVSITKVSSKRPMEQEPAVNGSKILFGDNAKRKKIQKITPMRPPLSDKERASLEIQEQKEEQKLRTNASKTLGVNTSIPPTVTIKPAQATNGAASLDNSSTSIDLTDDVDDSSSGVAKVAPQPPALVAIRASNQSQPARNTTFVMKQSVGTPTRITAVQFRPSSEVNRVNATNRHPAPLPVAPPQASKPGMKKLAPKPSIKINNVQNGIIVSWSVDSLNPNEHAEIHSYQIYAYEETSSTPCTENWRHVGDVKALLLPMAVTLTQFQEGQKYYFAVRAVDVHKRLGYFSAPRTWTDKYDWKLVKKPIKFDLQWQNQPSFYNVTTSRPPSTMKSILLTPKPSNNNQLSVGSQVRKNESSIPNHQHYLHLNINNTTTTATTTTTESAAESIEKEHYNKLFSNSKKQVIRNRCSVKSDVDKLKRVTASDVCDGKNSISDTSVVDQRRLIKTQTSDNNSDSDFFENRPLIVENKISFESENHSNGKAVKLINLRKKNGTTLIFQRKSNAQKHPKANEYQELESFKKRRSLQQWPNTGFASKIDTNNANRHSWYDSDYYPPRAIEEEFDEIDPSLTQLSNEDYNLADINGKKQTFGSSVLDGASSIEHVPEIISMKTSIDGSATSRRWRIEQFLKNLVGKKPLVTQQTPPVQKAKRSPSEHDLLQQQQYHQQQQPDPSSICGSMMSLNKERFLNKSTASLNSTMSLSMVHQKLWSVVPLLNRKDGSSCSNLLGSEHVARSNMRKCETVLALTHEPLLHNRRQQHTAAPSTSGSKSHSKSINNLLEPIKPLNRLRNSQSCYVGHESDTSGSSRQQACSRCSSLLSLAAIGSNYSLNVTNGAFVLKSCKHRRQHDSSPELDEDVDNDSSNNSSHNLIANDFNKIEPYENSSNVKFPLVRKHSATKFTCKLCLGECSTDDKMTKISSCGCSFCTECMRAYVEFEISEGAYELSCPDALCNAQGIVSLTEIAQLATPSLVAKHHRYRLNREVELDKNRLWCPNRNCETICSVGPIDKPSSSQSVIQQPSSSNATLLLPRSVLCPTCSLDFCSSCKKPWHPLITCEENSRKSGGRHDSMMLFDNDLIKCCPMCAVPIEKDEGCAQMMCKRCKHVFCWYCLASLDDDFLLRHYDKGPCKNKLGHSRASVVWHRAQVIGIFAGFGILLLVASPLLLLAAPCIVCCKCKIEESTTTSSKLDVLPMEDVRRTDHQV